MRQLCEGSCAAILELFGKFTEAGTQDQPDCRSQVESGSLRPRYERVSQRIDALLFCVRGSGSSP
jgi:hypothetical protein